MLVILINLEMRVVDVVREFLSEESSVGVFEIDNYSGILRWVSFCVCVCVNKILIEYQAITLELSSKKKVYFQKICSS